MRPRATTLTPQELELMKIIWRRESATVRDVYQELLEHRKIAYTTVMTALKTLEQKGYLRATQQDRAYVYQPTKPKNQVIKGMVQEFVNRVFNGSAEPLVVHLIEDNQLSESDLREISRMLGRRK
ncbi:MAG TPA: BlaI/MecI/CopY family transcriptional regulator [Terriglobia bacterium]|nr:BlaI/MecI/CopY family transcriptional regulator [Terriglobia bacterium]